MSELIIINGEESFLKERAANDISTAYLHAEVIKYDEKELDRYLEDICLVPLFGGVRLFIVRNVTIIPELPPGEEDVLVCISANKKKLKHAGARRVLDFPKFKTYDDNNEVIKWILKEGDRFNIDLNRVASALFVSSGKSLRKIDSEIKKLAVLHPDGGIVSPEVAKSVMCFSASLTPKQVIDSICEGNPAKALAYYDKLQEGADETGWIIAFLQRLVITQLKMELYRRNGDDSDNIAREIGVHPFVYRKVFQPRLGLWSVASLSMSVDQLCELDISHKGGDKSARIGLETEIVRLSEEAKEKCLKLEQQ